MNKFTEFNESFDSSSYDFWRLLLGICHISNVICHSNLLNRLTRDKNIERDTFILEKKETNVINFQSA